MKRFFIYLFLFFPLFAVKAQVLAPPVEIAAAEYFWNTDPGAGSGFPISVTGAEGVAQIGNMSLNFSGLTPGFHKLYLRFRDADGFWGIPTAFTYYLPEEPQVETPSRAEYFVDTRPAAGSGTQINVQQDFEISTAQNVAVSADSYSKNAFHKLYVRFGDQNQWGIPIRIDFYNAAERVIKSISRAEYFFDAIGASGTGSPIEVTANGDVSTVEKQGLPLTNSPGFRRLFFRFGDDESWGIPVQSRFYQSAVKDTVSLAAAEYFFDRNPGFGAGSAIEINPANSLRLQTGIPLGDVNPGFHVLYLRFRDAQGQWGPYAKFPFYRQQPRSSSPGITALEYFYSGSAGPQPGSANAFEPLDGTFSSQVEDGAALTRITQSAGAFRVYARAKDSENVWGIPVSQAFSVSNQRVIEGQIYAPDGTDSIPAPNTLVNLYANGTLVDTDTTGFKGFFSFDNLAAGTYEVQAVGSLNPLSGIQAVSPKRTFTLGAATPSVTTTTGVVRAPAVGVSVENGRFSQARFGNQPIRVHYSDALDLSSLSGKVTLSVATQGTIPVTVSADDGDSTLVITPQRPLPAGAAYSLMIGSGTTKSNGSSLPYSSEGWLKVNRGAGEFGRIQKIDSVAYASFVVNELVVGDLDSDLDNDIAVLRQYGAGSARLDSIVIRLNDGSGKFPTLKKFRVFNSEGVAANANMYGYRLFTTDWDKDGDLDLLLVYEHSATTTLNTLVLYRNDGDANFTKVWAKTAGNGLQLSDIVVADVTHDGFPDVLLSTTNSRLYGMTNSGTVDQSDPALLHTWVGFNQSRLSVADYSNDGVVDLTVNAYIATNNVSLLTVPGTGSMFSAEHFTRTDSLVTLSYLQHPESVKSVDFDNDGFLDVVALAQRNITEWKNRRNKRGFTPNSQVRTAAIPAIYYGANGFGTGDINNDGVVDFLISTSATNGTNGFLTWVNSASTFGTQTNLASTGAGNSQYRFIRLADMDGDGDLDAVYNRYSSTNYGTFWIHFNSAVSTNRAPVLAGGSDLGTAKELTVGTPLVRNLQNDYSDPDTDPLVFSASSKNATILTASVSGSTLTLTPNTFGITEVDVVANDLNGGIHKTTFRVVINPAGNKMPVLVAAIRDTSMKLGASPLVIQLSGYFSDPESAPLTFTAQAATNSVLSVEIVNTSQLRIAGSALGTETITVRASDGTSYVEDSFQTQVIENVNRTPVLVKAFRDTTMSPGNAAAYEIALAGYFSDPDSDVLTYSASTNNTNVATVSILASPARLRVTPTSTGGTATITVTARDPGNLSISDQFTVSKANQAPILVKALRDTVISTISPAPYDITLANHFSEPDGESLSFTASSTNTAAASVTILSSPSRLRVTPGTGSANVTVTAQDPFGLTATDVFIVQVKSAPRALVSLSAITALTSESGTVSYTMSSLFTDSDNAVTSLTTSFTSTAPSVATFQRMNSSTIGVYTGSTSGTATLTVQAIDGDGFQSGILSLQVTVKERNFVGTASNAEGSYYENGVPAKTWTLFSIPGTLSSRSGFSVFQELSGSTPFKLYDITTEGIAFEVQPDADAFLPGRGYWFKTTAKDEAFNVNVGSGQRQTNRTYDSFYGTGWRFVANPFDAPATWGPTVNVVNPRMWRFDEENQTWILVPQGGELKPWTAYVFHSFANTGVRLTQNNGVTGLGKVVLTETEPAIWEGTLKAGAATLVFGEQRDAQEEADAMDIPVPPSAPGASQQPVWKIGKAGFQADFRPLESNSVAGVARKHSLYLPAGKHALSVSFTGESAERSVLIHGSGAFVMLNPGETHTLTLKEAAVLTVQSGPEALLERLAIPENAQLFDAFPNPFNPSTVIRFALPQRGQASLEMFDLTGRKVATSVNGMLDAGFHQVRFDARSLSSGVYLYRFVLDGKVIQTKKMTLVK